ncbi:MAG: type IX secretion system membrane protein PorP/SprF [Prevotellaceae bacterium]|nr:type IX secretion system membrane protein PorP/SprF [Prevotellaceae bacterium]
MKKILIVLLLASVFGSISRVQAQQIPQFSQYMFNGLYINPAYAGYKEELYAHLMFRKQWMGVSGAPQTVMLGVDADLGKGSNLGLVYANDNIGATATNSIMLSYAYRFHVSDQARLSFGLSAGAIYYGLNKSKVDDHPWLLATENVWRPQADVGVYFDMPDFYVGFSAMSLISNNPKDKTIQIMRTDPTFFLTTGGMIHLSDIWALAPSTLLKTDFKSPLSIDLTTMVVFSETLWLGCTYRTGLNFTYSGRYDSPDALRQTSALVIVAELYLMENLRLGAAYDFDLNSLATGYNGGIEVSLGYYLIKSKRRYATPRYF